MQCLRTTWVCELLLSITDSLRSTDTAARKTPQNLLSPRASLGDDSFFASIQQLRALRCGRMAGVEGGFISGCWCTSSSERPHGRLFYLLALVSGSVALRFVLRSSQSSFHRGQLGRMAFSVRWSFTLLRGLVLDLISL